MWPYINYIKSSVEAANQKWFSRVVPHMSCVQSVSWADSSTAPVDFCQFPSWRKQTGSSYAVLNFASDTRSHCQVELKIKVVGL